MRLLRGLFTSVALAVCVTLCLALIPIHHLRMGFDLQTHTVATSVDPLQQTMQICKSLRLDGRIERIQRQDHGIQIVFASNQQSLNGRVYTDLYTLLYHVLSESNVSVIFVQVLAAKTGKPYCLVKAEPSDLQNPLPKPDAIVPYVLRHFQVQPLAY
jgi:hypothetical protein